MKRTIVWFTTDLRLLDNETLNQAISQSDEVIPVYCFDESHFTKTQFGFKKIGKHRKQFLIESIMDLDNNLRALGSGLLVVNGDPEKELLKITEKYKAEKIVAKKQVGFEEIAMQKKVARAVEKLSCVLEVYETANLYKTKDLPFEIKQIPDVFTDFKIQVERKAKIRSVYPEPINISSPPIEKINLSFLFDVDEDSNFLFDSRAAIKYKGGESTGKKRLNVYLNETHSIATYKNTRNGMIGENYSSKFSAWLALGCLSPVVIYHEIKKYEKTNCANESTYWLVFELLWRDYFAFMMQKYPYQYFNINGIKKSQIIVNQHEVKLFQSWCNGQTANDFINANMNELNQTGFMSNRGRQNVASYLCHDLKLDWRYGAAYFEKELIDYDVSSNWCNWAYIAGVGNNPRGASIFNIEKQAHEYDKNKLYRKLWLTQL